MLTLYVLDDSDKGFLRILTLMMWFLLIIIHFQLDERYRHRLDMCLHVSTDLSQILRGVMSGSVDGLYITRSDFEKCYMCKLCYIYNKNTEVSV